MSPSEATSSDEGPSGGEGEESFEFEATLTELEAIIDRLDGEGLGLDEAIALFERGIERLGAAKRWLDGASGRIEELIASSSGSLETVPFEGDVARPREREAGSDVDPATDDPEDVEVSD